MKEIKLSGKYGIGKVALIDDDMYDRVMCGRFVWYVEKSRNTFYVLTQVPTGYYKQANLYLHSLIMGCPNSRIDHINGDGLDNRKLNLRPATNRQNCMNKRKREGTTSIYKGVSWDKKSNKWRSQIMIDDKVKCLGWFIPEHEHMAAMAYDLQALEHFGEFAKTNF